MKVQFRQSLLAALAVLVAVPAVGFAVSSASAGQPPASGRSVVVTDTSPPAGPECGECAKETTPPPAAPAPACKTSGTLGQVGPAGPGYIWVAQYQPYCTGNPGFLYSFNAANEILGSDGWTKTNYWVPVGATRVCLVFRPEHADECWSVTVARGAGGKGEEPVVGGRTTTDNTSTQR